MAWHVIEDAIISEQFINHPIAIKIIKNEMTDQKKYINKLEGKKVLITGGTSG